MGGSFPRRGNVNPRALVGKILLINGVIFWIVSALLAAIAVFIRPAASVLMLLALIFVGVGLLEGAAGLLVWFFPGGESPTSRLVNRFYGALEAQDYAAAYACVDLTAGGFFGPRVTEAEFDKRAREYDAEHGPVTNYGLIGVQANPGSRIFTIRVTRRSAAYRARLTLAQSGAGWKITSFDRL
jgi:hypothetical protein